MTTHDGEIIRRSREQPAAFAELYDQHERVIFRYAARRLGVSEADDITSETFLVAFTRRRDFTGSEDARPWLLGIATTFDAALRADRSEGVAGHARVGPGPQRHRPDRRC